MDNVINLAEVRAILKARGLNTKRAASIVARIENMRQNFAKQIPSPDNWRRRFQMSMDGAREKNRPILDRFDITVEEINAFFRDTDNDK